MLSSASRRGRRGTAGSIELLICLFNATMFLHKVIDEVSSFLVLKLLVGYTHCVQECPPFI